MRIRLDDGTVVDELRDTLDMAGVRVEPLAAQPPEIPPAAPVAPTEGQVEEPEETSNGVSPGGFFRSPAEKTPEASPVTPPQAIAEPQPTPATPAPATGTPTEAAEDNTPTRSPIPAREVSRDTAVTSTGRNVPVRYAVVEAASLTPSQLPDGRHNPAYPAELQPRDRTRGTSIQQVNSMAQALDPRLLDMGPRASDGAPIIAPDGIVESGNGRTLAIQQAYQGNLPSAMRYRDHLENQGYPVDGMQAPVLVRIRDGEMTPAARIAFTREANERDTLELSATERAMADARAMPDRLISLYRGGDIDAAANRDFVRAFMQAIVNPNEQAAMIDANGAMSQDAVRRVGTALLAKAYGDSTLVAAVAESADSNIRAIGGALLDMAGRWANMRADAAAGRINGDMDQTSRLLEAVRLVERARKEGRSVAELVTQKDIFSGESLHPVAEAFLSLLFRNTQSWTQPAGRGKIAEALGFYVEEAGKTRNGIDLLGESSAQPEAILRLAKERQYDGQQEQQSGSLFARADGGPVERPGKDGQGRAGSEEPGARAEARPDAARDGRERTLGEEVAPGGLPAGVTITPTPSGKSITVQGISPAQAETLAKTAGMPGKPLPRKDGGFTFAGKYEAAVRKALTTPASRQTSAAAKAARKLADAGIKGVNITGVGPFGPILAGLEGRWADAVRALRTLGEGDVRGALSHPDVGSIDMVWGEAGTGRSDGYGLAKLEKFHPDVIDDLPAILADMQKNEARSTSRRVQLESETHAAGIRLQYDNVAKTWLLTAFQKDASAQADDTLAGVDDQIGSSDPEAGNNIAPPGQPFNGRGQKFEQSALPATIDIDGIERPTTNSKGQPIHATEEGVRNFWAWFGDSKVVDAEGRPLVVYHGTRAEFEAFDIDLAREDGFWFTDTNIYAQRLATDNGRARDDGIILSVYLRAANPMIVDVMEEGTREADNAGVDMPTTFTEAQDILSGSMGWSEVVNQFISNAKWKEHDALIFTSFNDNIADSTAYVVFDPTQIKSTDNAGAFDPTDERIRYQLARKPEALKEFQKWSRVKKPVYHATAATFDAFDTSLGDLGSHFGSLEQAEKVAERWAGGAEATITKFYINLENPLRLKDEGSFHGWAIARQLVKKGILSKPEAERIEAEGWREQKKNNAIVRDAIKEAGYDGVVYKNAHEGADDSYIVFEPTQVKAAEGNSGAFNPADPRFRFSISPALANKDVPVVAVRATPMGGTFAERRLKARLFAQREFGGKQYRNEDMGRTVLVSRSSVTHSLDSLGRSVDDLAVAVSIPDLLKHAVLYRTTKGRDGDIAKHDFYAAARLQNGELRRVKIVVREQKGGLLHYSQHIVERDVPVIEGAPPAAKVGHDFTTSHGRPGASIKLSDLLLGVNPERRALAQGEAATPPAIELTGDEIGATPPDGPLKMRVLRNRALNWYRANLLNKTATTADGHEVRFTMRGGNETVNGAGENILRAIPAIRAIIERGTVAHEEPGNRANIRRIQWISAPVQIAGKVQNFAVMVREHNEGWLQYDLTDAVFPGARSETGGDSRKALFDPAKEGAPGKANIAATSANINLYQIDPQARTQPWDTSADALANLQTALAARLQSLGIDDKVALHVVDGIRAAATGEKLSGVDGSYYQSLIQVAFDAPDATWTLNHEVIHALRALGLFKPAEWTTLRKAALADTARMQEIRNRYREQDLTEDELVEEAIADMFADWHAGQQQAKGFMARAFERLRAFLRALHSALTGSGFRTADSVFRAVERGDVGRRRYPPTMNADSILSTLDPNARSDRKTSLTIVQVPDGEKALAISTDSPRHNIRRSDGLRFAGDTEARWQAARQGLRPAGAWRTEAKEWLQHKADGFTRHWQSLPNTPRFADVGQQLRKLEAAPQHATDQVVAHLRDITKGMTPEDMDLLTRKVVLDDLAWEAQQEHDLPFGFTPETLASARRDVDAAVKGNPKVRDAARRRKLLVNRTSRDLVKAGVLSEEQVRNPSYYRHQVLDYARAQSLAAKNGGSKVSAPNWAKRMGSTMDINANLLGTVSPHPRG